MTAVTVGNDIHLIIDRLFIGDINASKDDNRLRLLGVTLIV